MSLDSLVPDRRKVNRVLIWMLGVLAFISFAFLLVTIIMRGRHQDVGCQPEGRGVQTQSSNPVSLCNFEAFVIVWAAMVVAYMWMFLCVDLALKTAGGKRFTPEQQTRLESIYLGVSFAIPTFFLILELGYKQLGRSEAVPWWSVSSSISSLPFRDSFLGGQG